MSQAKRLLVMAGGTGGMYSGLAVAHYLQAQGWEIRWLGTADRMEATLVPQHGIEIEFIRISGLRGKGALALAAAPWRIFKAIRQAKPLSNNINLTLYSVWADMFQGLVGLRLGYQVYLWCYMNKMGLQV